MKKPHYLSVFSLVMINVIAVDSLRTIPFSASYGLSLVFFYMVAGIGFFLPTALAAAELASAWPERGGVYVWVREAFGNPWAFLVIWVQWVYNICWYPTILSLLAATFAYLIDPHLVDNRWYMLVIIFIIYWTTTAINMRGMRASSLLSSSAAILGTLIPLCIVILLGLIWIFTKQPLQIELSWSKLWPDQDSWKNVMFFTNVLFGLAGIEMSAVHAREVRNPQRDYPRALLYSSIIIFSTLVFASLAVALVVPHLHLGLVDGLLEAYRLFFAMYHLEWMMPIVACMIILGGIGGVGAWIIGPSKGLLVAAEDGCIPPALQKVNRYAAPVNILWVQGGVFTLLCGVFLFMPSVNSSFWLLSDLTSLLSLVLYIFMFAAVIRLRYKHPNQARAYRIPGGRFGVWGVGLMGLVTCFITIGLGFVPPSHLPLGNLWIYEGFLVGGLVGFTIMPLIIYHFRRASWARTRSSI